MIKLATLLTIITCLSIYNPFIDTVFEYESKFINNPNNFFDKIDTNRLIIIPYDSVKYKNIKAWKDYKSTELNGYEILQVDSVLDYCIAENKKSVNDTNSFSKYIGDYKFYKQLMPFVNKYNEKIVFVNCFCRYPMKDNRWKEEMYFVSDGGNCYFHVYINLKDLKYYDLLINSIY